MGSTYWQRETSRVTNNESFGKCKYLIIIIIAIIIIIIIMLVIIIITISNLQ